MKAHFQIFKKLKYGESGLGWNEMSKTIEAPESWWTHVIQVCTDFFTTKINKFTSHICNELRLTWICYHIIVALCRMARDYIKPASNYNAGSKTNPELNFPHPIGNKYYLVGAVYAHKKGYMAPYKGSKIRYHLQDFRRANERYNHLHSSCRMVIERTFGAWKARFAILTNMPMYTINTQTDIVLATMMVHNYIKKSNENYMSENSTSRTNTNRGESSNEGNNDEIWNAKRDEIAAGIK
ncbi:hypothetical protein DCAR_0728629 [Daucus carota subsp. sativus]|uniref:DDE Tnp4 domain-containing protein n=1 Tax=Daucus carota subsp. sativus TaxID=79200 RepID=A0AAF0XLW2_DAUCS|nr:hypothetical protein DCAR_0728629 [Daucus carota subsp. sativus]